VDAVVDGLSPYIDAAPLEEQKYFLATQQADEARHAVFFNRFMHEVAGIGDGRVDGALQEIRPRLNWGFERVFGRLETSCGTLQRAAGGLDAGGLPGGAKRGENQCAQTNDSPARRSWLPG